MSCVLKDKSEGVSVLSEMLGSRGGLFVYGGGAFMLVARGERTAVVERSERTC